jgi:hypothetical protein
LDNFLARPVSTELHSKNTDVQNLDQNPKENAECHLQYPSVNQNVNVSEHRTYAVESKR